MPTSFKTIQIKILTYGIYALMAFLAVITRWHTTIIKELPDDYVRLERYVDDRIDEGEDKPYVLREKGFYIRRGSTNRLATRDELNYMLASDI